MKAIARIPTMMDACIFEPEFFNENYVEEGGDHEREQKDRECFSTSENENFSFDRIWGNRPE